MNMKSIGEVSKLTGFTTTILRKNFANGRWPAEKTGGGQLRYMDEQIAYIIQSGHTVIPKHDRSLSYYLEKGHVRYIGKSALDELIARTPNCTGSNIERLYWLQHELIDYPTCKACKTSLSSNQWLPTGAIYREYCGKSCAYLHGPKKESYEKTCLERYGVDHPMKTPEVISKIKVTNIQKYGEEFPMRWGSERWITSIEEKFGVRAARHLPNVHEKTIQSIAKKTTEFLPTRIKSLEALFDVSCETDIDALGEVGRVYDIDFSWKHTCGKSYTSGISERGIRRCPSCSAGTSQGEQAVGNFIRSLGFDVVQRTKNIIAPREIDIWIPSKNLAIEFDGTYWHSAKFEGREKSMSKIKMCDDKGIRLITVQEHLWVNKPELVKSRLESILSLNTKKIPGRKTSIVEIGQETAKKFLAENHLQGSARASIYLGLFFDNELVEVATFGKPRWAKSHDWELIRMATKVGFTVQGGASKLISAFRKKHDGSLISYADRCWSTGNVYEKLGFKFMHHTAPSYWWIHHCLGAYARYQTQKKKLPRLLGDLKKPFFQELSEEDNMRQAGFLPLFDRGNSVWVLK